MDKELSDALKSIDEKIENIDNKVKTIDEKLDGHSLKDIFEICEANGQGIEGIELRFQGIDSRLDKNDHEIESLHKIVSQNNLRGSR